MKKEMVCGKNTYRFLGSGCLIRDLERVRLEEWRQGDMRQNHVDRPEVVTTKYPDLYFPLQSPPETIYPRGGTKQPSGKNDSSIGNQPASLLNCPSACTMGP